jgi:hypothetical protein
VKNRDKVSFSDCILGEKLDKIKAVTFCGVRLRDFNINQVLLDSIVILNLSCTGIQL